MGCDITLFIEEKTGNEWDVTHTIDIPRNYTLFSILANVENNGEIPYISEPRGVPEDASNVVDTTFHYLHDYHSCSWLTREELKNFNWSYRIPMGDGTYSESLFRMCEECVGLFFTEMSDNSRIVFGFLD